MRAFFLFTFLAVLVTVALAWEKEDHEIFDLVGAIETSEGKGTTFYSWLDVPSTASTSEIAKAYRKKSMQLHPDKNPNDKKIHERFARLGVVSTILRNKESRDRYDFFYKNGVPVWRGTGYYYSRFRPGLGTVLTFLILVTSGFHYIAQKINYGNDVKRMERLVKEAQLAAWGTKLIPVEGQRKASCRVKVNVAAAVDDEGESVRKRYVDMVVDANHVYLLDPSGDMHLLDKSTVTPPTFSNTWFFALVKSLYQKAFERVAGAPKEVTPELESYDDDSTTASDAPGSGTVTPKEGKASGGKRKKATKKRNLWFIPVSNPNRQNASSLLNSCHHQTFPPLRYETSCLRHLWRVFLVGSDNSVQQYLYLGLPDISGLIADADVSEKCEPPALSQHSSFSDYYDENDISELIMQAPGKILFNIPNSSAIQPTNLVGTQLMRSIANPPRQPLPSSSETSKSSNSSKPFSRSNSNDSGTTIASSGSGRLMLPQQNQSGRSVLGKRRNRDSIDASAGPSKPAKFARPNPVEGDGWFSPYIISRSSSHQRQFNQLGLPYGVQFEIARIAAGDYAAIDMDGLAKLQGLSVVDAVPLIPGLFGQSSGTVLDNAFAKERAAKSPWAELHLEVENLAKDEFAGLGTSHESALDWFGGKVHFTAKLIVEGKNKTIPYKVVLKPPELGPSNRFARRWGSERFLTLGLSKDVLKKASESEQLIRFLQRPFILGNKVFRAFDAKDANVFLVCTNEIVEGGRVHPTRTTPGGFSLREFLAWHNALELNPKQTMAKWASRFALGRSNSAPVLRLEEDAISYIPDITSTSGDDMSDGAGLINKAGLRLIYNQYEMDSWPTAIQVRLGLLVMHPTDDNERPLACLRPSQIKVKHTNLEDPALRTVDLLRSSHTNTRCRLPVETIINLGENGVPASAFINLIETALVNAVTPLVTWEGPQAMEKLWWAVSRAGGVMSARMARQETVLARVKGYSERDSAELEDDDEEGIKDEPVSTAWWIDAISRCPSSLEETVMHLLDAGFNPRTCSVLRAKLEQVVNTCVKRCINSYRIDLPVGMSAMAFLICDELGVLEEGEFFLKTSHHNLQTRSGMPTDILLGPALITRHPCKLPTDVQKWTAVDRPELRHYTDVIVLSVKGSRRAADYLSGGDYDGDKGLVIWQPELVDKFVNADLRFSQEPPELREMQAYLLSGLRDMAVVGQYSNWHLNATYSLGYRHSETIRLAYMFCKTLDGAKTGLTVLPGRYKDDQKKYNKRPPEWKENADKKEGAPDTTNMLNLKRGRGLGTFIMDELCHHASKNQWGTTWGQELKAEIEGKFKTDAVHVVDGDLTAPWLEFEDKQKDKKEADGLRNSDIELLAKQILQKVDADSSELSEAKDAAMRLLKEVEDAVSRKSDLELIKEHVEGVHAKHKTKIRPNFSRLPIERRQDILRELSRDFATGPSGLRVSEEEAARLKASYAYLFDSDERQKKTTKWTRFPWDVAFGELCLIKTRASKDLKAVKSDFYEKMTIKVR
ncbi:RNA-dependent RNA polymerase [Favolaschia claudopus]|uniref:RNA-dependent RNA polymerase n=1 Tax=Favolaschia claudopus TaxID=2862362 RepID=A0AAW0EBQ9_9AGAR